MGKIQRQKIELYKVRTFSDKFADTFSFISENWKPLLKYTVAILAPFSILQAFFLNSMFASTFIGMADTLNSASTDAIVALCVNYCVLVVLSVVGIVLLASSVYGLMDVYARRPERLMGMSFALLRPSFGRIAKRLALAVLAVFVLFLPVLGLAGFFVYSFPGAILAAYAALLAVSVPLAFVFPVCSFEDVPLLSAVKKSLVLGFKTWGGTAVLLFITAMLVSVVLTVATIPWTVCFVLKDIFVADNAQGLAFTGSWWFQFLSFVLAVVYVLGAYIGNSIMLVALAYQYGHAADKLYGQSVAADIDSFDSPASGSASPSAPSRLNQDIDNFDNI